MIIQNKNNKSHQMKKFITMVMLAVMTLIITACGDQQKKVDTSKIVADSLSARVTNAVSKQLNPTFGSIKEFKNYRDSLMNIEKEKAVFISMPTNAFEQCANVTLSIHKKLSFELFMKEYKAGYDHVYKYLTDDPPIAEEESVITTDTSHTKILK
mgnify:FL=1|jgi:hypothetical protein